VSSDRYPENLGQFVGQGPTADERFAVVREDFLLSFGYQTARAYWGDLESWWDWASARDKDVLALTEADIRQYVALLRRRKYSESTIRRRKTALRGIYLHVQVQSAGLA